MVIFNAETEVKGYFMRQRSRHKRKVMVYAELLFYYL